MISINLVHFSSSPETQTQQCSFGKADLRCRALRHSACPPVRPTIDSVGCAKRTAMLNVQDECDLPEDDGYDLFTRETERRDWNELQFRARRWTGGYLEWTNLAVTAYGAK